MNALPQHLPIFLPVLFIALQERSILKFSSAIIEKAAPITAPIIIPQLKPGFIMLPPVLKFSLSLLLQKNKI